MTDVVIMKHGDEWVVQVNEAEDAQTFETEEQAIEYADEQAKVIHGQVMIENGDGELVPVASYRPLGVTDKDAQTDMDPFESDE